MSVRDTAKPTPGDGNPLTFDAGVPVEVRTIQSQNPHGWNELGSLPRGKEFHKEMGENLPTNHAGIDNWDPAIRTATSFKTRDLRTDSYNTYDKLYKQLDRDLKSLQKWDGKIAVGDFISRPGDVHARRLDIGIPDGAMNLEQKQALEDFAREAARQSILFRVTVIQ